jgi:hypothetical protein
MKTTKIGLLSLSLFLIGVCGNQHQASVSQKMKDRKFKPNVRVRRDKPTVYLSFQRAGQREPLRNGESDEGIWLRLHNNTQWAIKLEMNDAPSKEYGDVVLFYEVISDSTRIVDMRCHVCSVNNLSPGKSLSFSLPREFLNHDEAIRISFNYEWEPDEHGSTSSEPVHYVYFYNSQLPPEIQRGDESRERKQ